MKYWNEVIKENLTYEEASKNNNYCFTRPEWDGIHFRIFDDYYILLSDGKILKNPSYIDSKDKNDWVTASITFKTWVLIKDCIDKNNTCCDFCVSIANEMPKRGSGDETIYHDEKGFGIYLEQYRHEYAILENVKYCPCCGRKL